MNPIAPRPLRRRPFGVWLSALAVLMLLAAGCAPRQADRGATGGAIRVVATTSIVGDVVSQVGGEFIDLALLLPLGSDPHSFDPAPQDMGMISNAALIFANGAGLEVFLDPLLQNAGASGRVVRVSDGITLLEGSDEHGDGGHSGGDPHVWTDPNNVLVWTEVIAAALSELDPEHAGAYQENASRYQASLEDLDGWIRTQVSQIPEADRLLVTDHTVFTYFAARYGFEQVGAIVPGYSSMAEPSAQELARLEDAIKALAVKAIFVGDTVNPALSERVAADTGSSLVFIYTGSLSGPDGEAASYLDYMRYNVTAIVEALR